jgi:hypothetical protein
VEHPKSCISKNRKPRKIRTDRKKMKNLMPRKSGKTGLIIVQNRKFEGAM